MSHTETPASTPPPVLPRGLKTAGVIAAVIAIAIVTTGLTQRARSKSELKDWTVAQALPSVSLVKPLALGEASSLQLPGRTEAYASVSMHARVSGYLKAWHHDIGTAVKAGDLLAEIETPDLDQQLLQARADLASAEASASLARTTAERWQTMLGTDAVSQQEVDEKLGAYAAAQAAVKAARANVDRLVATQGFKRIVAPFDGTVTSRTTDVGALIDAGGGAGPELFSVADTRRLRVYVQLAQNYAPSIREGQEATLTVPEHPGREFKAVVESTSNAVNANSGATLVQLSVDNSNGALLPGGYASVQFALPADATAQGVALPASSLIFNADGLQIAVLGSDDKVALRPIQITRDLGKTIEVTGIQAGDRVIDSPPEALATGDAVQIVQPDAVPNGTGKPDAAKKG